MQSKYDIGYFREFSVQFFNPLNYVYFIGLYLGHVWKNKKDEIENWFNKLKPKTNILVVIMSIILIVICSKVQWNRELKLPYFNIGSLKVGVGHLVFLLLNIKITVIFLSYFALYYSKNPIFRYIFESKFSAYLGKLSFNLYIVHWIILKIFQKSNFHSIFEALSNALFLFVLSLIMAHISIVLIDKYIIKLNNLIIKKWNYKLDSKGE